jgi:ADP-ribosylglycohydrolase
MNTTGRTHYHLERLGRALLSLEGLSVGDAFGGKFFIAPGPDRAIPPPVWRYSDDTEMALAIVEILERHGEVERDDLAQLFARRYRADPYRGYGLSVRTVLEAIADGQSWQDSARLIYGGSGSMGNGGAMRVAPIGAYFADDLDEVIDHARASAVVTHAHPEGQAGAIATALAAAWAWQARDWSKPRDGRGMIALALEHTPEGETYEGLWK